MRASRQQGWNFELQRVEDLVKGMRVRNVVIYRSLPHSSVSVDDPPCKLRGATMYNELADQV